MYKSTSRQEGETSVVRVNVDRQVRKGEANEEMSSGREGQLVREMAVADSGEGVGAQV